MTLPPPDPKTLAQLLHSYRSHDLNGEQADRAQACRELARQFAVFVATYCPPSRERSLALTAIEEASMWAVKSIAVNETEG